VGRLCRTNFREEIRGFQPPVMKRPGNANLKPDELVVFLV